MKRGFFLVLLLAVGVAQARNSDWGVGIGATTPYFFDPVKEQGDSAVTVNGEWRLTNALSVGTAFDFALIGFHEVMIGIGPRYYFRQWATLRPFVEAMGIVQMHPRRDGGIRGGVGLAWTAKPLFGSDRIVISAQWNGSYLFRAPESLFVDLYRVGLTVYY